MTRPEPREHIEVTEAARRCGKSRQRVHQYLQEQRVPNARRMLRTWLVPWPLVVLTRDRSAVMAIYDDAA